MDSAQVHPQFAKNVKNSLKADTTPLSEESQPALVPDG